MQLNPGPEPAHPPERRSAEYLRGFTDAIAEAAKIGISGDDTIAALRRQVAALAAEKEYQ